MVALSTQTLLVWAVVAASTLCLSEASWMPRKSSLISMRPLSLQEENPGYVIGTSSILRGGSTGKLVAENDVGLASDEAYPLLTKDYREYKVYKGTS
jgi:hypothetical protein